MEEVYRNKYFEFSRVYRKFHTRHYLIEGQGHWATHWLPLGLSLCYFEESRWSLAFKLVLFSLYIHLPFLPDRDLNLEDFMHSWGFSFHSDALLLSWGGKTKCLFYPWRWEHVSTEHRLSNGTWWTEPDNLGWSEIQKLKSEQDIETHVLDYVYHLKRGETQHRKATVTTVRRTWKRKCLPFIKQSHTCIEFSFSDEVGEESGTWKGGVMATAERMLPGETVEQCFRRMEKTRAF